MPTFPSTQMCCFSPARKRLSGFNATYPLRPVVALLALLVGSTSHSIVSAEDTSQWPQWRGQAQNGVAKGDQFPLQWSEQDNLLWQTELPGQGGSTPVVAGSNAYLTAGVDGENTLLSVNIETGRLDWKTSLGADRGGKHRKGGGSNPSPVTDGERVFAYYRSGDLACVGIDGTVQWQINLQKEFGEDTLWWDLGTSPMLMDDMVVVAVMQSGPSYLVAFDGKTGDQKWFAKRETGAPKEAAQSYATPLSIADGKMIAVMGADTLTIHSASDGKELGRVDGFNPEQDGFFRSISSPVTSGDIIVCPYSRGNTVTACRISDVIAGKGRDSIAWFRDDMGSDVPTPAIVGDVVYFVDDDKQDKGTVTAVDLKTGTTQWTVKLPKSRMGYSSSPLVAANHLYVVAEDAKTYVLGPLDADQPTIQQTNELADADPFTVASPVPVKKGLLLRTRNKLHRFGL